MQDVDNIEIDVLEDAIEEHRAKDEEKDNRSDRSSISLASEEEEYYKMLMKCIDYKMKEHKALYQKMNEDEVGSDVVHEEEKEENMEDIFKDKSDEESEIDYDEEEDEL